MNLKEKNVILTGANRGIGLAILKKLAKEGCNIWACCRTNTPETLSTFEQIARENCVWIKPIFFDLNEEESIKEGVLQILSEKKPIDVLVNNAGIPYGGLFYMTPMSKLKEVFQINYFSQIYIMQLVARYMMRQKKGCIVNMASVGGIETNAGYLAYGSSKAALIWATKSISKELGKYNIRVNAVAPGLTETQMGHYKSQEEIDKVLAVTSLGRMGTPEEIARSVCFLASEEASFITGQVLIVDGGRK